MIQDNEDVLSSEQEGICASVTIEIEQSLTLTQQGFEAKLEINNAAASVITDVEFDLFIRTEDGKIDSLIDFVVSVCNALVNDVLQKEKCGRGDEVVCFQVLRES